MKLSACTVALSALNAAACVVAVVMMPAAVTNAADTPAAARTMHAAGIMPVDPDGGPPACPPLLSAPLPLSATTAPAGPLLRRLAGRLRTDPAYARPGRYFRVTSQQQAVDSAPGAVLDLCPRLMLGTMSRTMWRDEHSNRGITVDVPRHAPAASAPPVRTRVYARGQLIGAIAGTVPSDPAVLDAALTAAGAIEPDLRIITIGEIATHHATPRPARRALLRVLAAMPGLLVHTPIIVAGRTGLPVSLTSNGGRQVLILDPATGQIIGFEYVELDEAIGRYLGVQVPSSTVRTLITSYGRTSRLGPPYA